MGNRVFIDTGEIVDSPVYDLGTFHIDLPDEKVMEYMSAFAALGFTPRHEVTGE